ncbi:hypothetical protein F5Y15DRAFT_322385 [Xylariaceae sp. FL0016]|nr:hypothetical protein F5Y15DRAFT_322385 [Xylariaceae sp. FL0016]
MERKRKLPARGAAARADHLAKKRAATPSDRSLTPAPAPVLVSEPSQAPEPSPLEPQPQLPKSIQPGNPLPTVENPQPDELSSKEFQSVQESGVLAESLSRSRQRWVHEGVFEKYWTKPTKRKGIVKVEPNNPPKDSMVKIGQIAITVEPHVIEATVYMVKDPNPAPTTNSTFRPIMQYGPPNGTMPPPPKPVTPATPSAPAQPSSAQLQAPSQPTTQPPTQGPPSAPQTPQTPQPPPQPQPPVIQPQMPQSEPHRPPPHTVSSKPLASPRGLESVLAAPQQSPAPAPTSAPPAPPPVQPNGPPTASTGRPLHAPGPVNSPQGPPTLPPGAKPAAAPGKPATPTAANADPIIVTLAEKASEDPHLRDLMKRVAIGEAAPAELAHFQRIIDQITVEYRKKGGRQGPSPDRLIVDGKTVKYFADEVRTILEIILASNPKQKSSDLRPPPGSDPLVILLVKECLDKVITRDRVRRIAEGKPQFEDAVELKSVLDRLKDMVVKETVKSQQQPPTAAAQAPPSNINGGDASVVPNGTVSRKSSVTGLAQPQTQTQPQPQPSTSSQQALRSKGPPPVIRPDISAIVLEFSGGSGDRYLFPKYSILEYSQKGTQCIASFLIVRKGSKLEYGGDPALDYYQPITIRMNCRNPTHLQHLSRYVADRTEVRRYMDDVMENMTRAEYVLLAMRLPRAEKDDQQPESRAGTPKTDTVGHSQFPSMKPTRNASLPPAASTSRVLAKPAGEEEQYQSFIASVS